VSGGRENDPLRRRENYGIKEKGADGIEHGTFVTPSLGEEDGRESPENTL